MNLTSEPHPLLSPGIKCRNPLQLLVPYLVPHLDMQATTSKAETTLRNSLLASAALLTHSLPGGVALGSVCFTQRLSMNFCRAGWRQTKSKQGFSRNSTVQLLQTISFPFMLCSAQAGLQSEIRIGLHGPLQAPYEERP